MLCVKPVFGQSGGKKFQMRDKTIEIYIILIERDPEMPPDNVQYFLHNMCDFIHIVHFVLIYAGVCQMERNKTRLILRKTHAAFFLDQSQSPQSYGIFIPVEPADIPKEDVFRACLKNR